MKALRMPAAPVRSDRTLSVWLGVLPFIVFALVFLILPTLHVVLGAFRTPEGGFTLANLAGLMSGPILGALWMSLKISLWTAFLGCVVGLAIAGAVTRGGLPAGLRDTVMTFSGVASNFWSFGPITTVGVL